MENLKFEDMPAAMEEVLGKLSNLEKELKEIKQNFQPKEPVELLTREETAEYLKIDSSTLWSWTKKGKIKAYGIGHRVYYKKHEIDEALVRIK